MEVICHLHGEDIDDSVSKCFFCVSHPVTLAKIQDIFPFENKAHFRVKVFGSYCGVKNVEYLWLDLVNPNDEVPGTDSSDFLEIQALLLETADSNEDEYLDFMESMVPSERRLQGEIQLRRRVAAASSSSTATSSSAGGGGLGALTSGARGALAASKSKLNMKSVKKGATGIWNAMKATASHIQQVAEATIGNLTVDYVMSPEVLDHLEELGVDCSTTFDYSTAAHVELLTLLYGSLFPAQPSAEALDKAQALWKSAGWQNVDPTLDLKTSGLLALRAMLYMGDRYPAHTQRMLEKNKANMKVNYPFAIVGINMTLMLIELFHLRESQFAYTKSNFWKLFEDKNAFYEVFSLCFLHLDHLWVNRGSTRADFGKLIGEVKALVLQILAVGPQSVGEFRYIAGDEGMVVLA